jgi:hypothetical protein
MLRIGPKASGHASRRYFCLKPKSLNFSNWQKLSIVLPTFAPLDRKHLLCIIVVLCFSIYILGVGLERAPAASLKTVWGIARPHTQYYLTGMLPPKEGLFTVKSWSRFGRKALGSPNLSEILSLFRGHRSIQRTISCGYLQTALLVPRPQTRVARSPINVGRFAVVKRVAPPVLT